MPGFAQIRNWLLRRRTAPSAVERIRQSADAPIVVRPWQPSQPAEQQPDPDVDGSLRVISLEARRRKTTRKPRGLADDDWQSRTSA